MASFDAQRETSCVPSSSNEHSSVSAHPSTLSSVTLWQRLLEVRQRTLELTMSLSAEDQVVQAHPDASPMKWHLAHTTWFFESFVLREYLSDYAEFSEDFEYCFNSYYESKGSRHARHARGLLTRPSLAEVLSYRDYVDEHLQKLQQQVVRSGQAATQVEMLIEIGIQHEQQHQELMLTDILALFASQPLRPAFSTANNLTDSFPESAPEMLRCEGGIYEVGHQGEGFAFDNEGPRHKVYIQPFRITTSLVTNSQWIDFIDAGGYQTHSLWLSEGWNWVQTNQIESPAYWEKTNGQWQQMTLFGMQSVAPSSPVRHVSFYEADAFAKWCGKRLPTEFEWEVAVGSLNGLQQVFGSAWQWTASAYLPYPGYYQPDGAIGEYNGKFMCSQMVLRGSSIATPPGHERMTYRNFFYPSQRWQFTGLRLAKDER